MPLTEEQKARIEANRRKALEKRKQASGRTPTPPSLPKRPLLEPKQSNVKTFYGISPGIQQKSRVKGSFQLVSPTQFVAEVGYNEMVVNIFKSMKTSSYQAKDRIWKFDLEEHDSLLKKLESLKPDVIFESLPKFLLKVFISTKQASSNNDLSQESLRSTIEPSLYDALMPFQKEGIEFALKKEGRAIIADDMGLGKTIQALGVASYYRKQWPLLIICPSSMRFSWRDSVLRWLPSIAEDDIAVITSGKDHIGGFRVIIISYDLLAKKEKDLIAKEFQVSVVDECHFLKNHKSNRFQSADKILKQTERMVFLSGTPALSRPIELYSQLSILMPKLFTYPTQYGMRYCDGRKINFGPRGSHFDFSGSSNMNELKILLEETCMIRRLKSQVLRQLPSKQREMIILDPALIKNKISKEMKDHARKMDQKSLSSTERRGVLLEWFNLTGTTKAKAVLEYIKDLLESDKKFLCFAHHQVMMNHISDLLESKKVRFIRIDGSTSSETRNLHCEQFQSDEMTKVALLSITAANTGLTLTSAQLVVFAELFWNPGVLTQAEDRAHRIGQTDSVLVKYLVARGTADDELWPLLQKKLDILNKAGLSKDNFLNSDSTYHKKQVDPDSSIDEGNNSKITSYFNNSNQDPQLGDLNIEDWGDDDFAMDE